MMFCIVARSALDALAFARLNDLDEADFMVAESVPGIDGIANLTAVFVAGWRERPDALAMMTKVNQAEIHNVKIVEAQADDLLIEWMPALFVWSSLPGEP